MLNCFNKVSLLFQLRRCTLADLFREEVLRRLDPTDLALLRRVNRALRAAVEASSDLPRAGVSEEVPLKVGRCRLTVSKLVLDAPMVSALERAIWLIAFGGQGGSLVIPHTR